MTDDQILQLVALVALLAYLLPGAVNLPQRLRRQMRFAAIGLVAAGILYALLLTVL